MFLRAIQTLLTGSFMAALVSGCGAFDPLMSTRTTFNGLQESFSSEQALAEQTPVSPWATDGDSVQDFQGRSNQLVDVKGDQETRDHSPVDHLNLTTRVQNRCEIGEVDIIKLISMCNFNHPLILTLKDTEGERIVKNFGPLNEDTDLDELLETIKSVDLNVVYVGESADFLLCIDSRRDGQCGNEHLKDLNDLNDNILKVKQMERAINDHRNSRQMRNVTQRACEDLTDVAQAGLVLYHKNFQREPEGDMVSASQFVARGVAAQAYDILKNLSSEADQEAQSESGESLFRASGVSLAQRDELGLLEINLARASQNACPRPKKRTNGCFAEGTLVTMDTGLELSIEKIQVGDSLSLPDGRSAKVLDMIKGPEEKPLVNLHLADGSQVSITSEHPMITERGLLQAHELTMSDRILNAKGDYQAIFAMDNVETDKPVYNLSLEGLTQKDRMIITQGIVTGDLELQEQLRQEKISTTIATINSKVLKNPKK